MPETVHTFCRICEVLCGLEADVESGRAVALRPDPAHVSTAGFACPKGLKQHRLYSSPDRLLHPERRDGDRWSRVSWDSALEGIGGAVRRIRERHGPDAIAMYVGTAAGFSVLHPIFAQGFMTGLGSKSMYATATQDCSNKFAVARAMYGFPFTQPFPDLDRTECLIVTGANPVVSKWSFLQVPNPAQRLKAIEARGGKVYFVDPRRTESARTAGEHVPIRPDTDVFFFLAFLQEIFSRGGHTSARDDRFIAATDQLARVVEPWTPERCERVTRIPAAKLREMVTAYLSARGAAMYSSTGVNMGQNGSLAFWLQESINAITGNLDRLGGTLVGRGIFDFPAFGKRTGTLLRDDRSRIGGFRSVNDAFPGGVLADEILTPGRGQVRALFVTGGNPLVTMPNAGRLREAFSNLELLVTVDLFKNETGSLAHYVLPATSPLERADLPFIFPLMLGLQIEPYLQATRRVEAPRGEVRDEATLYLDLCRASGVSLFGSRAAQRGLELMRSLHSRRLPGRAAFAASGEAPLAAPAPLRARQLRRARRPPARPQAPPAQGRRLPPRPRPHARSQGPRRAARPRRAGRARAGADLRARAAGRAPPEAHHAPRRHDAQLLDPQPGGFRRGRQGHEPPLHAPRRRRRSGARRGISPTCPRTRPRCASPFACSRT
ncbi:MAG: molybdopterin-dependent oxidoreductase [Polyangiaceae bacterium]